MLRLAGAHGSAAVAFFTVLATLAAAGCGGPSLQDEMGRVPGLCFAHAHVASGFDTSVLPEAMDGVVPLWLCDSLLRRGPLGLSLLGINLTDLSPQLLYLSRDADLREMAEMAAAGFGCAVQPGGERLDLVTSTGSLLGSAGARDGWTCLITGGGSGSAVDRWLELEEGASLSADTGLVSVADGEGDLTLLVSRNSISFLAFIPDGMLSRSERQMLNSVRSVIQQVEPEALRLGIGIGSRDPLNLFVEVEMLRAGGQVSLLRLEASDSDIPLDSLPSIVAGLTGS